MSPEVREKYDKVSEAAKIRAAETEEKKQAFIRNISSFAISKFCEAEAMEKQEQEWKYYLINCEGYVVL